jgi:serine/threonine protein kinase
LKGKTPNEKIENVTKFRMNLMKFCVSSECSKLIRNILKVDPKERPTIKEILGNVYVLQISQKFNWDLKKFLKFRKMKNNNLQVSMISGMSYNTTNTSQSDSFYFEKRILGLQV